ncbi:F-box protein SKIP28 [Argentina anserina]|uniref:F-box protein SKIP28 n=1 Tax=Argentina anserina TaxID=57926 RepID=UPI002176335A|nr:F-box protein SKIP28 [Potentilla anserina]
MQIPQVLEYQENEAVVKSAQEVPVVPSDAIIEEAAGPPHEALFLILTYLPLFELLAMNQVCTSLRDAVNKDVLSWLNIVVEKPLSSKLSDVILIDITSKANGRLKTLALMNCAKITDNGLQQVVEQNPQISKLYLPACTGLTPEGVIRAVKTLSEYGHGLNSIMINGIYNINKQHLDTLKSYLEEMNPVTEKEQPVSWPLLYREYIDSPTLRHDKGHTTIDLEVCPKCDEVRMVFDCPRWLCKRMLERSVTECRGCKFCILRCLECGGCVDSQEIEEAVCADILCLDCWLHLPKCNFCNKPYCKQHADNKCCTSGSAGFVCEVCYAKYIVNLPRTVEYVDF